MPGFSPISSIACVKMRGRKGGCREAQQKKRGHRARWGEINKVVLTKVQESGEFGGGGGSDQR